MAKIIIKKLIVHVYNDVAAVLPSEVQDRVNEAAPVAAVAPAPETPAQTFDLQPSASEAPLFTSDNVLEFLRSDDRYRLRTAKAVAKHFEVDELIAAEVLDDLEDDGEVNTRRRRSDGVTLYEAA